MSVHGDDLVVLADDLGMDHVDKLLAGNHAAKNLGTLGFEEGCVSERLLLNRGIRCCLDDRGVGRSKNETVGICGSSEVRECLHETRLFGAASLGL